MTNQERAAEVIWEEQAAGTVKPRDLVDALADAGLLMPDLPEPQWSHDDPKWQKRYRRAFEGKFGNDLAIPSLWTGAEVDPTLEVFPGEGKVRPYFLGEPEEPVSAHVALQIGLKWLAAAKLAEGQE